MSIKYYKIPIYIIFILLSTFLAGCGFGFSKGNCGDNEDCFKNAVEKCITGITANTKYKDEMYKKWNVNQRIMGEENGLCKVYNRVSMEVEAAGSEAESNKERFVYYELGNYYNIVKTKDINKD